MKTKEFNLSSKKKYVDISINQKGKAFGKALHDSVSKDTYNYLYNKGFDEAIRLKDAKFREFIKKLKEELFKDLSIMNASDGDRIIDKLAGKELSK